MIPTGNEDLSPIDRSGAPRGLKEEATGGLPGWAEVSSGEDPAEPSADLLRDESARAAERLLSDLKVAHRQLAERAEALARRVGEGFASREAFGNSLRAEAQGILLTVDELLEGPSSLKRGIGVGLQGVLESLEAQEAEDAERVESLEKDLKELARDLSALLAAIEGRELADGSGRVGCLGRIAAEAESSRSSGSPLSLLCLRIEGLTATNERFGHEAGDQVVRVIARIAAKGLEPSGFLTRHGAGEFVGLLPGADLAPARACAEEIRAAVAAFRFLSKGERFPISVSVGAARFQPDDTPQSFLQRAYRASGLAHEQGGNTVVISED